MNAMLDAMMVVARIQASAFFAQGGEAAVPVAAVSLHGRVAAVEAI
jgi:hypothetical protein